MPAGEPGSGVAAIRGLLDEGLLSGQHETSTVLRPERHVRPVDASDLNAALAEAEWACQLWGGGSHPLLPVVDGAVPNPYLAPLASEQIDFVAGLQEFDGLELPRRVLIEPRWEHPVLLVAASEALDRWRPVEVVVLDRTDPWRAIYAAMLGSLPEVPDARMLKRALLDEALRFDEIVPIRRVETAGSLEDLIERVLSSDNHSPRELANMYLAYGLQPDTSFLGQSQDFLPNPWAVRRAAGPNVIVAMTTGSVEDFALLWNLRGAHGFRRVLPIGLPVEEINKKTLRELQVPGRATMFGLGGGACYLTSTTVPVDALERLATDVPSVKVVSYEQLLTFGPAPGRVRSHAATWHEGRTRLEPQTEADRDLLQVSRSQRAPSLTLDVTVSGAPLPCDPTMRGVEHFGRFQAGAAQLVVSELRDQETVEVRWPSSWTCLAAVAQSHGLDATPSEPGLAASTLIRALGSVYDISYLRHPSLIALIYRMAERSGMAWWRKRWVDVQRELRAGGTDPESLDRAGAALGRDDLAVAPAGEGRAVPYQEFVAALGNQKAASHWVAWAERRHLLVRGANVVCPDCRTDTWLPLAALPPPIACPGCGREILHPYNPRELRFTYRLGETLRRVLETDSLGHVLALRWFVELFGHGSGLVGAHPGVNFTDPSDKSLTIGEADVLLLFADGSMVPVEVKRRAAGMDERNLSALDKLTDALGASWNVLVATEPAREIPDFQRLARFLPDRPRVLLTNDQLHDDHVFWSMGSNPFEWDPRSVEADLQRSKDFANGLAATDPDEPWDRVADTLLNRSLGLARKRKPGDAPDNAVEEPDPASDPTPDLGSRPFDQ